MYYDERDNKIKYINEEKKIVNNDYDFKNHEHNDIDYDKNIYENNDIDLKKFNVKADYDKNVYENNYKSNEWDTDFKVNIGNINVNNIRAKDELFSAKEGLNKGNMFTNIYEPYKNYIYKVVVSGERDELLL